MTEYPFHQIVDKLPVFEGSDKQKYCANKTREHLINYNCTEWAGYVRDCFCNFCDSPVFYIRLHKACKPLSLQYGLVMEILARTINKYSRGQIRRRSKDLGRDFLYPSEQKMTELNAFFSRRIIPDFARLKSAEDVMNYIHTDGWEDNEQGKLNFAGEPEKVADKENEAETKDEKDILIEKLTKENELYRGYHAEMEILYPQVVRENDQFRDKAESYDRLYKDYIEALQDNKRLSNDNVAMANQILNLTKIIANARELLSENLLHISSGNFVEKHPEPVVNVSIPETTQRKKVKTKTIIKSRDGEVVCPFCGSSDCFIKKGPAAHGQNYLCKKTSRHFVATDDTIRFREPVETSSTPL